MINEFDVCCISTYLDGGVLNVIVWWILFPSPFFFGSGHHSLSDACSTPRYILPRGQDAPRAGIRWALVDRAVSGKEQCPWAPYRASDKSSAMTRAASGRGGAENCRPHIQTRLPTWVPTARAGSEAPAGGRRGVGISFHMQKSLFNNMMCSIP